MIHWKANLGWWKRPSFLFQQSSVDEAKPGADLGPVVAEPALQSLTIGVVLSHHHQPCRIVDESSWAIFSKLRSSSVIECNPSWRVMGPIVVEPALQSLTIGVNLSINDSYLVIISHVDGWWWPKTSSAIDMADQWWCCSRARSSESHHRCQLQLSSFVFSHHKPCR